MTTVLEIEKAQISQEKNKLKSESPALSQRSCSIVYPKHPFLIPRTSFRDGFGVLPTGIVYFMQTFLQITTVIDVANNVKGHATIDCLRA